MADTLDSGGGAETNHGDDESFAGATLSARLAVEHARSDDFHAGDRDRQDRARRTRGRTSAASGASSQWETRQAQWEIGQAIALAH